jgi:NADH dehydrogenase (ubiquinone) 1 beta subcomplex subunit 8
VPVFSQYGLIPEDYKPFPEESMNGDYPDLKPSSADSRDGNVYWDMPEFRRNFGEPMHHDFDFQQETRLDKFTLRLMKLDSLP